LEGALDSAQIEKISDKDLGAEGAKGLRALVIATHDRTDREAHLQKELRRHAAGGAGGVLSESMIDRSASMSTLAAVEKRPAHFKRIPLC
jgi:hypothetical protein